MDLIGDDDLMYVAEQNKYYCPYSYLNIKYGIYSTIEFEIEKLEIDDLSFSNYRIKNHCINFLNKFLWLLKPVRNYDSLLKAIERGFNETTCFDNHYLDEKTEAVNKVKSKLLISIWDIFDNEGYRIKANDNWPIDYEESFFYNFNFYTHNEQKERIIKFLEINESTETRINVLFDTFSQGVQCLKELSTENTEQNDEIMPTWFKIFNCNFYTYSVDNKLIRDILSTIEERLCIVIPPIRLKNQKDYYIIKNYFIDKIENGLLKIDNLDFFIDKFFVVDNVRKDPMKRLMKVIVRKDDRLKPATIINEIYHHLKRIAPSNYDACIKRNIKLMFIDEPSGFTFHNIDKYTSNSFSRKFFVQ